jgi:hypothetical protein
LYSARRRAGDSENLEIGQVTDYRVYILNDKGHIQSDKLIVKADDAQAIEAAKKIVGVRNVEIWDGERLVGRFKTTPDS